MRLNSEGTGGGESELIPGGGPGPAPLIPPDHPERVPGPAALIPRDYGNDDNLHGSSGGSCHKA